MEARSPDYLETRDMRHRKVSDYEVNDGTGGAIRAAVAIGALTTERFERWRKLATEESVNVAQLTTRRRR